MIEGFTDRRKGLVIVLALIAATYVVYGGVLKHGFVNFDDDVIVYENSRVQGGLALEGIKWAFGTNHSGHWHPMTWVSHMLDCQLYGLNPGGHHLSSLLIHIFNVVVLFVMLRQMTGRIWESAFVAGLFAVHPLNVESVAWVAERKNVLSTSFWFLSIWAYASYAMRSGWWRYGLVLIFFVLGLMTKSMIVTLPFLLLVLDYWPLERFRSRRWSSLAAEKIPLFVMSGVGSYMAYYAASSVGAVQSLKLYPFGVRVGNALVAYLTYITKMIWPQDLAVFYPYPGALPPWKVVGAGLVLLAITVLVLRARKTHPYLPVGWSWYVGTLVPVIGLVQAGSQAMADRYAYVPMIGLFIMAGWALVDVFAARSRGHGAVFVAMAVILAAFATAARSATHAWENSVSLFQQAVLATKGNHVAHNNLGEALVEQGRFDEAVEHYQRALSIAPDYADVYHYNVGIALARQGRHDEAIHHYVEALRMNPGLVDAYVNLGLSLGDKGETDQAIMHLKQAIKLRPENAKAHFILGVLLLKQGHVKEVEASWREALRLQPNFVEANISLAHLMEQRGRLEEAISAYRQAIRIRPDLVRLHFALGLAYLKRGDRKAAMEKYEILKATDSALAESLLRKIRETEGGAGRSG